MLLLVVRVVVVVEDEESRVIVSRKTVLLGKELMVIDECMVVYRARPRLLPQWFFSAVGGVLSGLEMFLDV